MRCRNCHTVMMETDPQCPTCHASAASATAAAPGPVAGPSPLLMMLPIFGGAIGGAIGGALAGAMNSSGARSPSRGAAPRRGSLRPLKWTFGLVLMLGGGLFLPMALVHVHDTWKLAQREPQTVTAAELLRTEDPRSPPAAWIAYTFTESK